MDLNYNEIKYGHERRRYARKSVTLESRVYTSVKRGAYSCKVSDIGVGGAFIRSPFMPNIGETITYELLSEYYQLILSCNAKVVWLKDNGINERLKVIPKQIAISKVFLSIFNLQF